jgi:hypothetical protein
MSEILCDLSKSVALPVLIGVITYVLVDRLGEWKSRRNNCKLGIAILDSLLGEIRTGLNVMNSTYAQLQKAVFPPPSALLPTESWSGMQTIPDQVLLRVIAASKDVVARSFHPNTIRSVCKDYFHHMCANYNEIIKNLSTSGTVQQNLHTRLLMFLGGAPNQGKYIATTQSVIEMLEQTRELLDQNSKRWFPK